jgi:hypothetical protein
MLNGFWASEKTGIPELISVTPSFPRDIKKGE